MHTAQTIPPSFRRSRWPAYLLAVGLTALTLAVRVAIGSRFEGPTMIIFTIPVILSAYWGGIGPGLLSTVLSGLGAAYYILPPIYSFTVLSTTERWQEVILFLAGAVISLICEMLHRSRRRAEKVIAELNQVEMASTRLAAIVESSADAIISKDLNSAIITWNNGAENIFGYTAAEMVGTSIMRLIPADRHDEENQILGKIRRGESLEHFETLRQTKDGRLIDVSVTASPIREAAGKIVGVSKVARDITGRKRAENASQEAMHFAQSTIDALSAHVCVLDETGMILATNEAWRRFAKANPSNGPAALTGDNYLKVCDAAGASGDGDAISFGAGMRGVSQAAHNHADELTKGEYREAGQDVARPGNPTKDEVLQLLTPVNVAVPADVVLA